MSSKRTTSPFPGQLCVIALHESAKYGELLVNAEFCRILSLSGGNFMHVVNAHGASSLDTGFRASQTHHLQTVCGDNTPAQSFDLKKGRLAILSISDDAALNAKSSLQVSLSRDFAKGLGLRNTDKVWLSRVIQPPHATHVEITFRDQHITRGDMWRMIKSELADRLVYKGQRILSLGTVKAQVKAVFISGEKVQSAFFGSTTRPIFRSESAHVTILIQMSKEMWDFDADGSGEIMSSRVLEGFLPELFRRWQRIDVKHLVNVVLFTRMEHPSKLHDDAHAGNVADQFNQQDLPEYTDFYRVVASAFPSRDTSEILSRLKKEFKVFLRDVSVREGNTRQVDVRGEAADEVNGQKPVSELRGSPSVAVRCNILEAINLSLSQHSLSKDRDQDLGRTGASIIVISPGTGFYQVRKSSLIKTTNSLIEQGGSIELICLSRMPLHSVPLFMHSERVGVSHGKPAPLHCSYSIPSWIDVSYWTTPAEEDRNQAAILGKRAPKVHGIGVQQKMFRPRVRLHELQMMGIMENAVEKISLPRLMISHADAGKAIFDSDPFVSLTPNFFRLTVLLIKTDRT